MLRDKPETDTHIIDVLETAFIERRPYLRTFIPEYSSEIVDRIGGRESTDVQNVVAAERLHQEDALLNRIARAWSMNPSEVESIIQTILQNVFNIAHAHLFQSVGLGDTRVIHDALQHGRTCYLAGYDLADENHVHYLADIVEEGSEDILKNNFGHMSLDGKLILCYFFTDCAEQGVMDGLKDRV